MIFEVKYSSFIFTVAVNNFIFLQVILVFFLLFIYSYCMYSSHFSQRHTSQTRLDTASTRALTGRIRRQAVHSSVRRRRPVRRRRAIRSVLLKMCQTDMLEEFSWRGRWHDGSENSRDIFLCCHDVLFNILIGHGHLHDGLVDDDWLMPMYHVRRCCFGGFGGWVDGFLGAIDSVFGRDNRLQSAICEKKSERLVSGFFLSFVMGLGLYELMAEESAGGKGSRVHLTRVGRSTRWPVYNAATTELNRGHYMYFWEKRNPKINEWNDGGTEETDYRFWL